MANENTGILGYDMSRSVSAYLGKKSAAFQTLEQIIAVRARNSGSIGNFGHGCRAQLQSRKIESLLFLV